MVIVPLFISHGVDSKSSTRIDVFIKILKTKNMRKIKKYIGYRTVYHYKHNSIGVDIKSRYKKRSIIKLFKKLLECDHNKRRSKKYGQRTKLMIGRYLDCGNFFKNRW